ncbi:MAG: universal stress protein [Alphaproteobacteria bacterium]|nr:universal stress protein [Alphaproteobacteria bacterium]
MLKTILVAADGSTHANAAIDLAAEIAAKLGAKLIIVNVIRHVGLDRVPEELRSYEQLEHLRVTERELLQGAADEIVAAAATRARGRGAGAVETLTVVGDPADSLLKIADERKVDLIALGRRGLGAIKGLLLGSVSHKVSQLADCACITVPGPD